MTCSLKFLILFSLDGHIIALSLGIESAQDSRCCCWTASPPIHAVVRSSLFKRMETPFELALHNGVPALQQLRLSTESRARS